ncbi:soluble quino protein glucose/sorbosone dehydrogenase [Apodospora peruviana]|uniref:Soluble quino protein glucose/sorbosone dehydrogenase n=1 Tax=Apodospora peruviana TaxID=516989 RepID=A0AAE0IPG0_9PEZI|nr:soluble quino protein glucose/sorbosone dehydrogenase [Apodospora peruviana]
MMYWHAASWVAALAVLGSVVLGNPSATIPRQAGLPIPASCPGVTATSRYTLAAAEGWRYTLLATGLTKPRGLIFDTEGHLLVLEAGKGLTAHTLGSNGCISSSRVVISMAQLNHGLALSADGKTVYVSSSPTAWSYAYDATTMTATNQTVIVKGMNPGGHNSRTLAVSPKNPNLLLVSLGSNGNIDGPAVVKETGRAIVKVFDLSQVPAGGYTYNTQGWYLGYGLRNEIALVFDGNSMVWGVENSGDDLTRVAAGGGKSVDVHIDNPAEELNYLGDPSVSNEKWYGYPTCWTVGDPSVIKDKTFKVGQQFMISPNTTFDDASCAAKSTPPRLAIKAHSAPIDGKFDKDYSNMYVSLHGSWNRQPATGYKVIQIPFRKLKSGDYDPVAPQDSGTGYSDVLWTQNEGSCSSSSCLRPTGVLFHPDYSRMYVASDGSIGELYILYKA